MKTTFRRLLVTVVAPVLCIAIPLLAVGGEMWDGKIVQYGKMHEAIGMQQHQGRVALQDLVASPHFYGVAALKGLEGEVTIVDGKVTISRVDSSGKLQPMKQVPAGAQATMLVGAYVPAWANVEVTESVAPDDFDHFIVQDAAKAGVDTSKPFVFAAEGVFDDVRLHVINGACPLHARLKKIDLTADKRPFEAEYDNVQGTVDGVYAENAVGNLTHPGTAVHAHLVFEDPVTGQTVTGHLEQIGMAEGTVVQVPK